MERPPRLEPGVWAVLPTPFDDEAAVDHASIERLVGFYREVGVTGIVALGVFGEASQLAAWEQDAVARTVVDAAGEVPVVLGLSSLATAPAAEQAGRLRAAVGGRARAFMVLVNTADPSGLAAHLTAVADAGERGLVVQDYPLRSGVRVSPDALRHAVGQGAAVALKAESPPTSVAVARIAPLVDVPVFGGLGGVGLLDELVGGAAGAMTGFSHPEGLLAAVRAYGHAGFEAARAAFAPWLPLANFEGQQGIGLAIRKDIMRRRGLISSGHVRPPGSPLPVELSPSVEAHLGAVSALTWDGTTARPPGGTGAAEPAGG